ncbi:MAG: TrkH family potassium uptake protein [Archaeoglobaceae archaeon]|nr:TrkH family potassium uptake protein [Archaeoglobaceae archaeon]MDW8013296.1 TrkH family potassium uptake protein [Archaeoglobaceae archaeon]
MIVLFSRFLLFFSPTFLIPAIYAYYVGEEYSIYFLSFAITFALGLSLAFFKFKEIKTKDAFTFVALSWILVSAFGALPYIFFGINPINSFFESISGFTTTGASILNPEELPKSLLLWRGLTQWFGGIGIVVLFLAVFPSLGKFAPAVFYAEFPTVTLEKVKPRIKDSAIVLCEVYILLTSILFFLLLLLGLDTFDALIHALTTVSTGGFSTHSESIAAFKDWRVELVIAVFMFLGGTNFALLYLALSGKMNPLRNLEFRIYLAATIFAIVALTFLNLKDDIVSSFRVSAFQAISAITCTGYTTYNFNEWNDASKLFMIMLMFLGGCAGSTAGGLKIIRIYILIKYSIQKILKSVEPRAIKILMIDDKIVDQELLEKVMTIFVLHIFIYIISAFLIAVSGYDLLTALSTSAATLNIFGPGMGAAAECYADLKDHVKILLCFNMWLGRLEIFSVLILFASLYKKGW